MAADASVSATPNSVFSPSAVTIAAGEKVTWTNEGGTHNVHFTDYAFDEPENPSSSAWVVDETFTTPGTYHYVCEVHGPNMAGTVTVTAAVNNYTWVGSNGGSWESAANWSPEGIPGTSPTDTATIADGDTVLMGGNHTIARLDMSAGSARGGAGILTLTGGGTWSSARTSGAKTIVAATATLNWSGGYLFEGELENLGHVSIGTVIFGNGSAGSDVAIFDNQGTATLSGDLTDASQGGGVVQNPGALTGSGRIGPPLSNSGTVTAQGGVLELTGSINPNPGDYTAAGGAKLLFSGTTTGQAGARVTGSGTVDVQGVLSLPTAEADNFAVPGATIVGGLLFITGGSTGSLDLDGDAMLTVSQPFTVAGGTNTWTTATIGGSGSVVLNGTTTLSTVDVISSAELRLAGPSALGAITFGDGDGTMDSGPRLTIAGPATLAASATFADATAGGAPRFDVVSGGTLTLGDLHLTLGVPFSTAGTLGIRLDGATDFGRITAPAATLGGTLALTRADGFTPAAADTFRVITTTTGTPAGSFASVTGTDLGTRVLEVTKDASGVVVSSKAKPVDQDPTTTPTPTPGPTVTATPVPSPTPAPTVTATPLSRFATLVKLPRCAKRRSVRVTVLQSGLRVKALLGRRTLRRSSKSFTLRRLPRRAFTLKFEVTLADGRIVTGRKRFRPCKAS